MPKQNGGHELFSIKVQTSMKLNEFITYEDIKPLIPIYGLYIITQFLRQINLGPCNQSQWLQRNLQMCTANVRKLVVELDSSSNNWAWFHRDYEDIWCCIRWGSACDIHSVPDVERLDYPYLVIIETWDYRNVQPSYGMFTSRAIHTAVPRDTLHTSILT
jgi:hypothetical protein